MLADVVVAGPAGGPRRTYIAVEALLRASAGRAREHVQATIDALVGECPRCNGDGHVTVNKSASGDPAMDLQVECRACRGSGTLAESEVADAC